MKTSNGFAALLALCAALFAVAPAGAADGALPGRVTNVTLNARLTGTPQRPLAGEFNGVLRLRIAPDGIILGTYQPSYGPGVDSVNGGLSENGDVWLEIGASGQVHITGTYASGRITGVANGPGVNLMSFLAAPKV